MIFHVTAQILFILNLYVFVKRIEYIFVNKIICSLITIYTIFTYFELNKYSRIFSEFFFPELFLSELKSDIKARKVLKNEGTKEPTTFINE